MAAPRLFVPRQTLSSGTVLLDGDAHRYLVKVLRLGPGADVTLLDGEGGLYRATISAIGKQDVTCTFGIREPAGGEPAREVHLWVAVLKGERMDWVVQKATELGVAAIHLLETERTVVKGVSGKVGRWQAITREAAEQSERGRIPPVLPPVALQRADLPDGSLFCAERQEDAAGLRAAAEGSAGPLHVLIGPEGGWTPGECAWLIERGARPVTLGARILRAETAALAALCQLLLP